MIAAEKAEIDRTGTSLAEAQAPTLDRTNAEAVDAYNAKVERDKRIETYQAKVAEYNKEAEGVLATKDAYAKACENRRYDDRDLNDLQRKK